MAGAEWKDGLVPALQKNIVTYWAPWAPVTCQSQQKLFPNNYKSTWPGAAGKNLHSGRVGKNEEAISSLLQANPLPRPAQAQHHVRPVHQCQSHKVTWSILLQFSTFSEMLRASQGLGRVVLSSNQLARTISSTPSLLHKVWTHYFIPLLLGSMYIWSLLNQLNRS